MKLRIEHWQTFGLHLTFARHSKADRVTLRVGRHSLSLFADGKADVDEPIEAE